MTKVVLRPLWDLLPSRRCIEAAIAARRRRHLSAASAPSVSVSEGAASESMVRDEDGSSESAAAPQPWFARVGERQRLMSMLMVPTQAGQPGPRPQDIVTLQQVPKSLTRRRSARAVIRSFEVPDSDDDANVSPFSMSTAPLTQVRKHYGFTGAEDDLIRRGIVEGLTLREIQLKYLPHRNITRLRQRWSHLDPRLNKGSWTEEEERRLIDCISNWKDGRLRWRVISQNVKTRSMLQCYSRYRNCLMIAEAAKRIKKRDLRAEDIVDVGVGKNSWHLTEQAPISRKELSIMLNAVKRFGMRWSLIARELPGRSAMELHSFYFRHKPVIEQMASAKSRAELDEIIANFRASRTAPWTPEEDGILRRAMNELWDAGSPYSEICRLYLPFRTRYEIKRRWAMIDPNVNRAPLSASEMQFALDYILKFGPRFAAMVKMKALEGRTSQQLRSWWLHSGHKLIHAAKVSKAIRVLALPSVRDKLWPKELDKALEPYVEIGTSRGPWARLEKELAHLYDPPKSAIQLRKRAKTLHWRLMRATNKGPPNQEIVDQALKLRDEGRTWREIEVQLKYPSYTLWRFVKLLRKKDDQIKTDKRVEIGQQTSQSGPDGEAETPRKGPHISSEEMDHTALIFDRMAHGQYRNVRKGLSRGQVENVMRWTVDYDIFLYKSVMQQKNLHGISDVKWDDVAMELKAFALRHLELDKTELTPAENIRLRKMLKRPIFCSERCEMRFGVLVEWEKRSGKTVILQEDHFRLLEGLESIRAGVVEVKDTGGERKPKTSRVRQRLSKKAAMDDSGDLGVVGLNPSENEKKPKSKQKKSRSSKSATDLSVDEDGYDAESSQTKEKPQSKGRSSRTKPALSVEEAEDVPHSVPRTQTPRMRKLRAAPIQQLHDDSAVSTNLPSANDLLIGADGSDAVTHAQDISQSKKSRRSKTTSR